MKSVSTARKVSLQLVRSIQAWPGRGSGHYSAVLTLTVNGLNFSSSQSGKLVKVYTSF